MSSLTPFPIDLEIDEIAVTIDERSDDYVVGDSKTATRVINPYAKPHIRMLEATDIASIRAMGRRNPPGNNDYKKGSYKKREDKPAGRNTQMCKACLGMGHCITNPDTICYNVAKQQMCSKYLDNAENVQAIKSNAYRYKKDRKEKASRAKTSSKMDGFMRTMEDEGHDPTAIVPIINMARALALQSDGDTSDDESNSSE